MLGNRAQVNRLTAAAMAMLLAASFASGCTKEVKQSTASPTDDPAPAAAPTGGVPSKSSPSDPAPDVTVVDRQGYEQAVAKHRGKVVLVDYWATFCVPCRRQFPHTVELWEKNRERGLAVISLSFDEPSQLTDVQEFLASQGARFENLISKVGSGETSAEEFDFDGALPHYALYGRDGTLAKRLSSSDPTSTFRQVMIDEAIEELLAQPAP